MALGDERRPERRVEGRWSSPAGQFTWRTGTEVLDFGTQLTIFMVYEGIWGMSLSCNSSHHDWRAARGVSVASGIETSSRWKL